MTPSRKPFLTFVIEEELLGRIDDFRFQHRFESRAATIKWLLTRALEHGTAPTDDDKPAKQWGRKKVKRGGETP